MESITLCGVTDVHREERNERREGEGKVKGRWPTIVVFNSEFNIDTVHGYRGQISFDHDSEGRNQCRRESGIHCCQAQSNVCNYPLRCMRLISTWVFPRRQKQCLHFSFFDRLVNQYQYTVSSTFAAADHNARHE